MLEISGLTTLDRCVCVRVRVYYRGLVGTCMRTSWPCGECVICDRLVWNRTRNNAKSKRFRLFKSFQRYLIFPTRQCVYWCVCVASTAYSKIRSCGYKAKESTAGKRCEHLHVTEGQTADKVCRCELTTVITG